MGFLKKQQFLLSPTESAASAPSDSERCCYSTFIIVDKHMTVLSVPSEDHIAGHPWCVSYLWPQVIISLWNSCTVYGFVGNSKKACRFEEVLNVCVVPMWCLNIRANLGYQNLTDTKQMLPKSPSRWCLNIVRILVIKTWQTLSEWCLSLSQEITHTKLQTQNGSKTTTCRCGRGVWSHALGPTLSPSVLRRMHSLK